MPIPTDTLRDMNRLNRWFALSCVLMLSSIVWMIWEDYDRPWRGVQDNYMVAQAALAHLDYLDTQTEAFQARISQSRAEVREAEQEVAKRESERAELLDDQAKEKEKFDAINITHANAEAVLLVTRSQFETVRSTYGDDNAQTKAVFATLQSEEARVGALRLEKEHILDNQRAIADGLKAMDAPLTGARKRLTALERTALDAEAKEKQYSNVLVKSIINMPLMDFTAPKGTPARHEVRQLVIQNVRQELNYLQTYTTDRCTTCHVSISDKTFTFENLARRFERALPSINEALTAAGQPTVNSPPVPELAGDDVPKLKTGQVTDFWGYLSVEQKETYFSQLKETVNAYLRQTGRQEVHLEQPLLAHPNLDLFVHHESPHPMTHLGCTVCHEGNPQETDFVQAAHTPLTHEQKKEWKEKYYVTAAFLPNTTFESVEHFWERPMLPPKYAEAGCAKCHSRISDISEFRGESQAKSLNLGQDLFVRVGCVNCHNVADLGPQRKVGPDLRRIAAKLTPEFTEQWVFHPKAFRPSTWMPHFFLQENNGPRSGNTFDSNPVLRTETEVSAITHYLYTLSDDWTPSTIPSGLVGDVARGQSLFNELGCLGCHANVHEHGQAMIEEDLQTRAGRSEKVAEALYEEMSYVDRVQYLMEHAPTDRDTVFEPESIGDRRVFTRYAPELSAIGAKVNRDWLFGWLKEPSDYYPETRMPSLRLTDQEAIDLVEYLMSLQAHDSFEAKRFPLDDEHRRMVDDLMFSILASQNSEQRSRAIMDDADGAMTEILKRSVKGYWSDEQAAQKLDGMSVEDKRLFYLGNKMVAHYGCYACHQVGGFEEAPPPGTDMSAWGTKPLAQLDFAFFGHAHDHIREARPETFGHIYPPEEEELIYWSFGQNPEESVTHTHAAFAKHKMLNPRMWDRDKIKAPYDKLKMPNYYFTPQQADALVTYLLSRKPPLVSRDLKIPYDSTLIGSIADGRALTRSLNCVGCHKIEDNVAAAHQYYTQRIGGEEMFDEVNAPPWLRGEGAKAQYPWLYGFLNDVETLRPWLKVRMPSFQLTEEETTTLVEYFAGLSQSEAGMLKEHLAVIDDYIRKAKAGAVSSQLTGQSPNPDQWFASDSLRNRGEHLAAFAVKNRLVLSFDVDPVLNTVKEMEYGFGQVKDRTRFTADLFDVNFPFADKARPQVDQERFALGEELFYELRCLACHVLGDPSIPGANATPTAPNLNLTHKRLRQDWVHKWMQQPAVIQPGTKMPQWFPGSASAFATYPEEDRLALEAKYGTTGEDQMQLLMDFMYTAGARNYTAVQPGGLGGGATDSASDDEEESGEEEEEEEEEVEEEEEEEEE